MKRLINKLISERVVTIVIVINTLSLIVSSYTEPQLHLHHDETLARVNNLLDWLDYACVVFFSLEMLLKAQRDGLRVFWRDGWNRFDLIVVALSTPVLLSPWIKTWINMSQLSAVLILRVGRLFRLFRLLRFIPNRDHLYEGMKRALRASVGVFLGLLLINVVLSVGAVQLFGKYAPEHFSNPALASYSLFRVFTLEGWYEIPDTIAHAAESPVVGTLARLYFLGAVTIGGVLGLSLANAVFVDEMTIDNNARLEKKVDALNDQIALLREELAARGR